MLTSLLPAICLGLVGQFNTSPVKIPRTHYKIPSYPGAFLLSWGLVQAEVGASAEVIDSLTKSQNVQAERVAERMTPAVPRKRYKDPLMPALANALASITPSQKRRLGEIYLKYYDVSALIDPTVANQIGLSDKQIAFINERFNRAHRRYQEAQEAMFESFRKDNEELRKKATPIKSDGLVTRGSSYTIPRDIQNNHIDLTRMVSLLQARELTLARAEVRTQLRPDQLAKLRRLKGKAIPHYFYDGSNWGTGGPHPDLAMNIYVQAEMGFTLKEYLAIQKESRGDQFKAHALKKLLSRLTPSQLKILRGYELQYDREYSILRHDICAELGIEPSVSDKMRLRLEEIDVEAQRKADKLWLTVDPASQPTQSDYLSRGSILEAADLEKRLSILTFMAAAKKKKWLEMLGKPLPEIQPSRGY